MHARVFVGAALGALVSVTFMSCNGRSPTEPTNCSYTISPGTVTIDSEGGTGTVSVTAPAGCSWTAAASASWISITAGATGSGPGTVTYSVGPNADTSSRTATVTVGGQGHAITQQGRSPAVCTYDLSPGSAEFNKDGGSGSFTVTAPAACAWTAHSDASWIVISGGGQGTGTSTVSYTVSRHADIPERTATIAVAERRFTVRQSGDVGLCQYSVSPVVLSPCMAGTTVTASITTQVATCPWTATPGAAWLSVLKSSGAGSATLSISMPDNYDAPREGIVMVRWPTVTAGQNIRIAQAGCRYAVSRSAISIAAGGGTATFDVIQQSDPTQCGGATQDRCLWTARSEVPWITIASSMPRAGDQPVAFNVAANDSTAARTGRITVRDKVVTVTQSGK